MKEFTITPATFAKYAAALDLVDMLRAADREFDRIVLALPEDAPQFMFPNANLRNMMDDLLAKAEGK